MASLDRLLHLVLHPKEAIEVVGLRFLREPLDGLREWIRTRKRRRVLAEDPRPGSGDYLSGDGFRKLANHRFGDPDDGPFYPDRVGENDLVFCKADALEEFLTRVAPQIEAPFVLLTGNSDANIGDHEVTRLPAQVLRWYAQNLATRASSRVSFLPIGLENLHYYNNGVASDFERLRRHLPRKRTEILYGFNVGTNPEERGRALEAVRRHPLSVGPKHRVTASDYRRRLSRAKFVLSPPGHGIDCHRTWEALYLATVPIVRRGVLTESLQASGLPVLVLDEWTDLLCLERVDLDLLYEKFRPAFSHPLLSMKTWEQILRASRSPL